MVAVASLRASKKARTRDRIAAVALERFASQGFDATTIDEIAQASGVARRTFFRYFETKEAALFPRRVDQLARFVAALETSDQPPYEAVRAALVLVSEELVANAEDEVAVHRVVTSSAALIAYDRKLDLEWESVIADALSVGQRSAAGKRRAKVIAAAMMGVVRAVSREWLDGGGKGNLTKLGLEAIALLEDGIRDNPPTKRRK